MFMRHKILSTAVCCLLTVFASAQTSMRGGAQSLKDPVTSARSGRQDTSAPPPSSSRLNQGSTTPKRPKTDAVAGRKTSPSTGKTTKTTKTTTTTTRKTTIPALTSRNIQQQPNRTAKSLSAPTATVAWMTIEEALEKSKTEKRKIFIDVYTDWCGWCRHMDSTTFVDPAIVSYLNEKYYAVKFNAEQQTDIVYKDKTYKFKKQGGDRGYHELAVLLLNNRLSYPTTVVLNESQDIIQPIPGFQDAKKMDVILHYFGTDNHKRTPWEKYERNYGKEQR